MTVENDIGLLERTLTALGRPAWDVTPEDIDRVVGDVALAGRAAALAIVRDLALFLADDCGKRDWALTDVHDLEAFLTTSPKARKRRVVVLGQFFRFARSQKIVLVDPARGLTAQGPSGFTGAT